jgi:hypothetical protein
MSARQVQLEHICASMCSLVVLFPVGQALTTPQPELKLVEQHQPLPILHMRAYDHMSTNVSTKPPGGSVLHVGCVRLSQMILSINRRCSLVGSAVAVSDWEVSKSFPKHAQSAPVLFQTWKHAQKAQCCSVDAYVCT